MLPRRPIIFNQLLLSHLFHFKVLHGAFRLNPQRRVIIKGSLKKRLRQTKQIRKFSKEKCQLTFNLLNAGGAHGDAEHLERSKQK
jgi:hypothetical protein